MIESGRVVERVMRMGIEHRAGISNEALWDLATKQLTEEDKRTKSVKSEFGSIEEWFSEMKKTFALAYAFVKSASGSEVVRFSELPNKEKFAFAGWSSPTMPRFNQL